MSTEPTITLESDGDDTNGTSTTFALKTTIQGHELNFPIIVPHQNETCRAEKRGLIINSDLVTFLQHFTSVDDFVENVEEFKTAYEGFANRHASNRIVNYSFDLHPDEIMSQQVVNALHEVQIDVESPFLFEYEANITQSEDELINQLNTTQKWLSDNESDKILVPVLDMRMPTEGLFLRKLEKLYPKYKRINVIYRSPSRYSEQWAALKSFLNGKQIWCHMDCLLNRYNGDKIAHRVRLYAMGISSVSIGFPFGGGDSNTGPSIYQFNSDAHTYEIVDGPHLPSFAERKDKVWINSLNDELSQLQDMRDAVIQKTLYTEFIPAIQSGTTYLTFTERI